MPDNDIYNNKRRYERLLENLDFILIPPEKRKDTNGRKATYYCKNKNNLQYFKKLASKFDMKDLSYVRRCRVFGTFRLITYVTEKDLVDCEREDMDRIVAFMHTRYNSQRSKTDFIRDLKYIWKLLLPEIDEKGREDETIMPYVVRHLKANGDKSREKARRDKFSWEEFESIIEYFKDKPCIQAYITLAVESLGRPQEILYMRIKDLELHENYAKLHISEHGKEGIGILQCIDSFPYVLKWYDCHPLKKNKESFLFLNDKDGQLTPKVVNNSIKKACRHLEIDKPITCYSLKRNGVTFCRLRGESDMEIQHKARWTSTKYLKNYDLSNQEDSFKIALAKRGLIKEEKFKEFLPETKNCGICGEKNIGFTEELCPNCKRSLDREKIEQESKFLNVDTMQKLMETVGKLQTEIEILKNTKD